LVLCGSETVSDGRRDAFRFDQYNHLYLVASAGESLREGFFPPRVSPLLSGGLGNPYHQFYSPMAHAAAAAASVLCGDAVAGYSASVALLLAFAFASMYRLGFYLTGSRECAAFAALLFALAPYLHADRTLRGAYAEYFAFCLLPAVTYLNLRALPLRSYRRWALAALATAALMLSHAVTAFYYLLFCALFILFSWISAFAASEKASRARPGAAPSPAPVPDAAAPDSAAPDSAAPDSAAPDSAFPDPAAAGGGTVKAPSRAGSRLKRAFPRKALAAASVAAAALLLSMYCMGPVILYDDLVMKQGILAESFKAVESGYMTPVLAVLSVRDMPFAWSEQFSDFSRFQAGFLACASLCAFAWLRARRSPGAGGVYARPFMAAAALVLALILAPSLLGLPVLRSLDVAQFSFRFLSLLTLAGAIAGALALKGFFALRPGFDPALKRVAVMALGALALALASPYLYPKSFRYASVTRLDAASVVSGPGLEYGDTDYMRPAPPPGTLWTDPARKALAGAGMPGDKTFKADLAEYRREFGGPEGEVLLDVLYYPGLQEVDVRVDGLPADLELGTWWQRRDAVRQNFTSEPGAFHGLKLTGAPREGSLEVRARFSGFRWANRVSALSLALLMAGAAAAPLRARAGKRLKRGNAVISQNAGIAGLPSGAEGE
jgi:hypothetical protein